jgi:hypothetical protein
VNSSTRRGFLGSSLVLALGLPACSSAAPAPPPEGRPGIGKGKGRVKPGTLQPGTRWNGTAGSGGQPAEQSDRPLGSLVPDERFTGGFSAIPGQWVHGEGIRITALGLPPQPAEGEALNYFKEAEFFLEGSSVTVTEWSVNQTPVRLHDGKMAPQGSIGFSVEIGAGQGSVTAGDAILYCFLRGEHGLERRIEIPLVINVDRALDAGRRTVYLDPVAGNDAAAGTAAQPWRTLLRALCMGGVGDGGRIVLMRAGRYLEDANSFPGARSMNNVRMVEVVAAEGLSSEQVVISRTARMQPEVRWVVAARSVHFQGVTIDLGKILTIQALVPKYVVGFSGCRLVDPAGENGPVDERGFDIGYNAMAGPMNARDAVNNPFPYSSGGVYLAECLFVNYTTEGARLYRNVTARESTDSFAGGPGYDNVVIDGYFVTMPRGFHSRLHAEDDLVVMSASAGEGNQTLIQLTGPTLFGKAGRRPDCKAMIVSGALAGQDRIQVISGDPTSNTLVLEGRLKLAAGDRLRVYLIWHADFCQQQGMYRPDHVGLRNTTIFRYLASSPTSQLFLTGGGVKLEDGTLMSSMGTRFSLTGSARSNQIVPNDIVALASGPQQGEYRFVASYDAASGTGTLVDPFSADQQGVPLHRGKTMVGFVMALSILHKTGTDWEMGQFTSGHRNFLLAHNSFISQPNCLLFRTKGADGHRNHVQIFNLVSKMDAETPAFPRQGLRIARCQFLTGTARGTDSVVRRTALKFDDRGGYAPPGGMLKIGVRPLIPFDAYGRPVDAQSPVGAIAG